MSYINPIQTSLISNTKYAPRHIENSEHSPLSLLVYNVFQKQKPEESTVNVKQSILDKIEGKAEKHAKKEAMLDYLDSIFTMPNPVCY